MPVSPRHVIELENHVYVVMDSIVVIGKTWY